MAIDSRAVRALIRKAAAGLSGPASLDEPLAQAEEAVLAAEAAGEPMLRLDALEVRAQALTAMGEAIAEDWRLVENAARFCEVWPRAAAALRMQVMTLLDDAAAEAEAPAARLVEVATSYGLHGDLAWAEAARSEIAFVAGRWDDASTLAMRAISTAGRTADGAVMLRAWHVVIPVAAERGDTTRLGLASYPYAARAQLAPDSPYRRLLHAAAAVRFAAYGLGEAPSLGPDALLPAIRGIAAMPHWLAALETVVGAWIAAGDFAAAEHAVELMSASRSSGNATGLGGGVEALLRARLLRAEGAPAPGVAAHGWAALEAFSRAGAPWWIAQAIRELAKAGEATPSLRAEAKRIERALSIRR